MSPSEIAGLDAAGATDATAADTEAVTGALTDAATAGTTSLADGDDPDRLTIDVLSREPVIRFRDDAETGAPQAVTRSPVTGATVPLGTGVTAGDITRELLDGMPALLLATRPIVREVAGQGDTPGHTDVIDPRTGEVVERLSESDCFGLDQAVRDFARRSLVDKAV